MRALVLGLWLAAAPFVALGPAAAQEAAIAVDADAIKTTLERHVGKRVRLRMTAGADVDGTVVAVGSTAVHLSRLAGMEFFDGVVRLDQIAGVIVRVRGN